MFDKLKLPVIVAPMFLVSSPKLVIESSRSGVVGSIPLLNAHTPEECTDWLEELKAALPTEPWAVNYISHKTNRRFEVDLELIRKYEPPIVISSLGNPGLVTEVVHGYGGLVFSDVSTVKHAKKAAKSGVDGLILVCAGAGGHAGTLNPFAFLEAVKDFWNGYTILAGGLSNGKDVMAARIMGADFAYMGTRFIAARESVATDSYKEMLIESTIEDILYTDTFSGVYANYLVPSLIKNGIDPASLKSRDTIDLSHMVDVKAWRDIWSAGQGVTSINAIECVSEIVQHLVEEYTDAKKTLDNLTFKGF